MKNHVVTRQSIINKYSESYPGTTNKLHDSLQKSRRLKKDLEELQSQDSNTALLISFAVALPGTIIAAVIVGIKVTERRVASIFDINYTPDALDYAQYIPLVLLCFLLIVAPLAGFVIYQVVTAIYELVERNALKKASSEGSLNKYQQIQLHSSEYAKLSEVLDIAISNEIKKTYGVTWIHTDFGYQVLIPGAENTHYEWVPSDIQHVIKNSQDKITVKDGDFEVSVPYKWHVEKGIVLHYTPVPQ